MSHCSVKSNIALAGQHVAASGRQQQQQQQQQQQRHYDFKHPSVDDAALYALAVESCLLVGDMERWPAYDETEVGERGISISGGQKARISLARAVYSNADGKRL